MLKVIYMRLTPFLAPFFLLTTLVFFTICVWRGEIILGLQAELIKDKNQTLEISIKQQESAQQVSQTYEQGKVAKQQEKIYVDREIEKVVLVPSYSSECFDNAGLQLTNDSIKSVNGTSESKATVPANSGDQ